MFALTFLAALGVSMLKILRKYSACIVTEAIPAGVVIWFCIKPRCEISIDGRVIGYTRGQVTMRRLES